MKTRFATLAALCLLAHSALGAPQIQVAPSVGLTATTIKGSDISGTRYGGQLGALIEYQTEHPLLQLETGLLYVQAGAKNDSLLASVEYELNYVGVPLGARYFLSEANTSFYVRGGGTLAYLVSAKQKQQFLGLEASSGIKSQVNSLDVLPYVGVGYAFQMAQGQVLSIDLNYTRGLMKVFKDRESVNQGVIVNASYSLPF